MTKLANSLCVLLTYLIESWISSGCSTDLYEVHTFNDKSKRKSFAEILFIIFSFVLVYLLIPSCKFVVIETRTYST